MATHRRLWRMRRPVSPASAAPCAGTPRPSDLQHARRTSACSQAQTSFPPRLPRHDHCPHSVRTPAHLSTSLADPAAQSSPRSALPGLEPAELGPRSRSPPATVRVPPVQLACAAEVLAREESRGLSQIAYVRFAISGRATERRLQSGIGGAWPSCRPGYRARGGLRQPVAARSARMQPWVTRLARLAAERWSTTTSIRTSCAAARTPPRCVPDGQRARARTLNRYVTTGH